jgi:hypothetical protein
MRSRNSHNRANETSGLALLVLGLLFAFPEKANAQCPGSPPSGLECVANGSAKEITAFTECRSITNNHASGRAMMIPVKSSPEWSSFYSHPPAGVTVSSCAVDPCNGKTIGTACSGTTALYAGTFDGGRYMVMPSGCADSTSNPSCSGSDTVTKTWNSGTSDYYDITSISNVASSSTASSSTERGDFTTPIIAAITNSTQGGAHAAARFCQNMVYGGYSDWYLPSKSELSYIYCQSTPSSFTNLWPPENPNCGGAGAGNKLTGFNDGNYWSSTENSDAFAWYQRFSDGSQGVTFTKISAYYVRCVRRY